MIIDIFTDGACSQNGTWSGGWGVVVVADGDVIHTFGGGEEKTTNNRMELKAFLEAVKYASSLQQTEVVVHTDSAYIANAFGQGWINSWLKNDWKNSKKEPVKNRDLWEDIIQNPIPKINKVKGHSDNKFNNEVDKIAVSWRDKVNENINNTRTNK